MTQLELEPLTPLPEETAPRRYWSLRNLSYRWLCAIGAVACFGLVGYALYVQHHMFMMPCPLCILQRVAFLFMGVWFVLGAVVGERWDWLRKATAGLAALGGLSGIGVAGWHVNMQYTPASNLPSCNGMDLSYMLEAFPLQKVIEKVFAGSAECAKIDWTFLGLSMPVWTLVCFVFLTAYALWAGWKQRDVVVYSEDPVWPERAPTV
jgi:disulfide bond formation protein DsbB